MQNRKDELPNFDRCHIEDLELDSVLIKIKRMSHNLPLPTYQTAQSSGMDLRAAIEKPLSLKPSAIETIPTGFAIALPDGYEAQVRPRSGLARKHGITVLNTPGTIDADYTGELQIVLINLSNKEFKIERGCRLAQLVIAPVVHARLDEVDELPRTKRGAGGFGSTDCNGGEKPND